MQILQLTSLLYLTSTVAHAATIPDVHDLAIRDVPTPEQAYQDLEKRKGGGGGGKGGSGGSSSSGSSSSSSGSSSSGSSSSGSSSGSSGSRSGSSSTSSNSGGRTSAGSGTTAAYGGGRSYAGGAAVPYTAGSRSAAGITPFLFPLAALSFFPGVWLYGAYAYPYNHPYYYHNTTRNDQNNSTNSSIPVECLCQQYSECGCDDTNNSTLVANMMNVTDGSQPANSSIAKVINFSNGTSKVYLNGTLENGTTASGGTDSGAAMINFSGYWIMAATVLATVMLTQ